VRLSRGVSELTPDAHPAAGVRLRTRQHNYQGDRPVRHRAGASVQHRMHRLLGGSPSEAALAVRGSTGCLPLAAADTTRGVRKWARILTAHLGGILECTHHFLPPRASFRAGRHAPEGGFVLQSGGPGLLRSLRTRSPRTSPQPNGATIAEHTPSRAYVLPDEPGPEGGDPFSIDWRPRAISTVSAAEWLEISDGMRDEPTAGLQVLKTPRESQEVLTGLSGAGPSRLPQSAPSEIARPRGPRRNLRSRSHTADVSCTNARLSNS
jgi:hypothetical protein